MTVNIRSDEVAPLLATEKQVLSDIDTAVRANTTFGRKTVLGLVGVQGVSEPLLEKRPTPGK
ncbi:hypothetical protein [Acidovorax sp.]|uniref:hypothetical protein n=1 Tax=Acidovorax sp. TaxID=1872122 RepID=UPI00261E6327|nr:hypothetical protein [Acidovorax sp.]